MKDELKAQNFRDLIEFDQFKAQVALEEETYNSLLAKLLAIDLTRPNVDLEYARLRGSLDALKSVKAKREHLVEMARSRN